MAKIAFLARLEACGKAFWGRSGHGHHSEKSIFAVFVDGLSRVWGGFGECCGVIWVMF